MKTKAILLDIEGTTTAIRFVHDVLFPYAKRALPEYVRANHADATVAALLDDVREVARIDDTGVEVVIEELLRWIEEDRKATPLKSLQGLMWQAGYQDGDFKGHVYSDTAPSLQRWGDSGLKLYVYSSGSVKAQKLLFGHSEVGDLRQHFAGYFDTKVGHKREAASYCSIADQTGFAPSEILFLSDVVEELDAARQAGMATTQLVRDEDTQAGDQHPVARNFSEVVVTEQPTGDS